MTDTPTPRPSVASTIIQSIHTALATDLENLLKERPVLEGIQIEQTYLELIFSKNLFAEAVLSVGYNYEYNDEGYSYYVSSGDSFIAFPNKTQPGTESWYEPAFLGFNCEEPDGFSTPETAFLYNLINEEQFQHVSFNGYAWRSHDENTVYGKQPSTTTFGELCDILPYSFNMYHVVFFITRDGKVNLTSQNPEDVKRHPLGGLAIETTDIRE